MVSTVAENPLLNSLSEQAPSAAEEGQALFHDARMRLRTAANVIELEPWIERVLSAMQMEFMTEFPVRMDDDAFGHAISALANDDGRRRRMAETARETARLRQTGNAAQRTSNLYRAIAGRGHHEKLETTDLPV